MNKKGFTLVELLSSITIMAFIATIASINIVKIFDNKNEQTKKSEESILTTAACVYIELEENSTLKETCLNYGCDIGTDILINKGLLNEEDVSNSRIIHIYKEKNEKTCVIK